MNKAILVPMLLLGACQMTPPPLATIPIVGNVCSVAEGTLIDEKTVLAAEILYNVPAHAYVTANGNGKLTATTKAVLKPKLITLYSLLQTVKAAKGTVNCDYNAMRSLNAEVLALIPR